MHFLYTFFNILYSIVSFIDGMFSLLSLLVKMSLYHVILSLILSHILYVLFLDFHIYYKVRVDVGCRCRVVHCGIK